MHTDKHKHRVFLGSSSESKWLAREIEGSLRGFDTIEVDAWYHFGSWSQGASTLESLEKRLDECDFAVLVLSEDDWTQSRDDPPRPAPRDNVIFELGLFMGRLGRDRAFFFFPKTRDFKLPSDLFGIHAIPIEIKERTKAQSEVSPACTEIVKQIDKVARRERAKAMQVRPKLVLGAKFPKEHGRTVSDLDHLSSGADSILKIQVTIEDETIDELKVYFDPRLNLRKATWTCGEDTRGRYFWASDPQLDDMKKGYGFLSFDVERPQSGARTVEVVAFVDEEPRYEKKFVIYID